MEKSGNLEKKLMENVIFGDFCLFSNPYQHPRALSKGSTQIIKGLSQKGSGYATTNFRHYPQVHERRYVCSVLILNKSKAISTQDIGKS